MQCRLHQSSETDYGYFGADVVISTFGKTRKYGIHHYMLTAKDEVVAVIMLDELFAKSDLVK